MTDRWAIIVGTGSDSNRRTGNSYKILQSAPPYRPEKTVAHWVCRILQRCNGRGHPLVLPLWKGPDEAEYKRYKIKDPYD